MAERMGLLGVTAVVWRRSARTRLSEKRGFDSTIDYSWQEGRASPCSRDGGEGGIRTHGPSRVNGFQDRRFRPLSHLSLRIRREAREGYRNAGVDFQPNDMNSHSFRGLPFGVGMVILGTSQTCCCLQHLFEYGHYSRRFSA